MATPNTPVTPPLPKKGFYLHTDGGVYEVIDFVRHSRDASTLILYRHTWPFESSQWVRPVDEWASRFKPLSDVEAILIGSRSRIDGQQEVSRARAARKQLAYSCLDCKQRLSLS